MKFIAIVLGCSLAAVPVAKAQVYPHTSLAKWKPYHDLNREPLGGNTIISWGTERDGLIQGASFDQDTFQEGQPILFRLTLTNTTAQVFQALHQTLGNYAISISLFVFDERGQAAVPLYRPTPAQMGYNGNRAGADCEPHGQVEWGFALDKIFRLEPAKEYFAYARVSVGPSQKEIELTSGNARFFVTPTNGNLTAASAAVVTSRLTAVGKPPPMESYTQPVLRLAEPGSLAAGFHDATSQRPASFAGAAPATKPTGGGGSSVLPAYTDRAEGVSRFTSSGSTIGALGWLLLALPLAVMLWILSRALRRPRQSGK